MGKRFWCRTAEGRERARRRAAGSTVFLVALVAALLFVSAFPLPEVKDDAVEYLALARNVAAGKGFTLDGATPAVYRPPLFSALLGGWFFITGTSSPLSAAFFQSLLHATGVLAAFLLFLQSTPSLVWATGAALFLAVNPLLVTRAAFVLQEPTILLFTVVATLLSVRLLRSLSVPAASAAGAAWGAATLAKIVSWYGPFLLLGFRLASRRGEGGRVRAGKMGVWLIPALCFAVVIAPWTIRNHQHFGKFIPVNDEGKGMLEWAVSNAVIPGESTGEVFLAGLEAKGVQGKARVELEWAYVRNHTRYFLADRVARNVVHFAAPSRDWWIATGRTRLNQHGFRYWVLTGIFHLPLYLLLLYRTWRWTRDGDGAVAGFPILFYWAYWAQYAVVYGDPRFGIPVLPLLVGIALPPAKTGGVARVESGLTGSTPR